MRGGSVAAGGSYLKVGVLVVSDRASKGVYQDKGGPAITKFLSDAVDSPWGAEYRIVPDEKRQIEVGGRAMSCVG
jgi:molybdopterin adenylyltransferase